MASVKDRVREALARTEPTEAEAKADFAKLLERTRAPARRGTWVVALAAAAALLIGFGVWRGRTAPPPVARTPGVHIYIHVVGEPEEQALALDVAASTAHGEH